jgi:hypothetical protein
MLRLYVQFRSEEKKRLIRLRKFNFLFVFDIRLPSLSLPFYSSEKEGFVVFIILEMKNFWKN